MKISIVTISFNQDAYLTACIESVLGQDYDDIEYILVDAGSTDRSSEIIDKYSNKVDKIIIEKDDGPADGLNKGFMHANGDVFCYLNADDVLLPGAVSRAVDYLSRNPGTDVVYGHGIQINESGKMTRRLYSTKWNLRRYAYGACNVVQQGTFFRKRAYLKAGGFNKENPVSWDGELLVDMALSGAKIDLLSIELGAFRLYVNSITGSGGQKDEKFIEHTHRVAKKILGEPLESINRYVALAYRIEKYLRYPKSTISSIVWRIRSTNNKVVEK